MTETPSGQILTAKQRRHLKGLAHHLEPVVRVGKAGASPRVIAEVNRALEAHELIKIRFEVDDSATREELVGKLAAETEASPVAAVGKTAILYRARKEKPRIKLP